MATKTSTRVVRMYTFTFDENGDKERFSAIAKKDGRTLAGLIKYLLTNHRPTTPAPN